MLSEQYYSYEEVLERYPHLRQWFETNDITQLRGEERLASADEKVERLGGLERVRSNLGQSFERSDPIPGILQACRFTPMIGVEIVRFFEILGKELDPSTLWHSLGWIEDGKHEEVGSLERVEGLTLVQRLPALDNRWIMTERTGLLTVYEGYRVRDPELTVLRRTPRLALVPKQTTFAT